MFFSLFFFQVEEENSSIPERPWKLYLVACFPMICPACLKDVVHPEANLRKEEALALIFLQPSLTLFVS